MKNSIAISIADQALLSLFNLALNACLVAYASPAEFGHYVFAATLLLFATSLQNAIVATPISVVYPGVEARARGAWRASILDVDRVFRFAVAALAVPVALLTDYDRWFLAATACLIFTSLARETQRTLALAENRTAHLIRIDGIAVAVSIAATLVLWLFTRPAVAALAGGAVGSGLAVWLAGSVRDPIVPRLSRVDLVAYYRPLWHDTRWALVGASTTEVQNRAYVVMLEVFRTARDIAEVQAGRLLMGPLPLLAGAWGRVARPQLARLLAAGDTRGALVLTVQGVAAMAAAGVMFAGALMLGWPLIERTIFRGRYPHVAELTAAWTLYTALATVHVALSAPLIAALRLKDLSHVTLVTSGISLLMLLGLAAPVPLHYVVAVSIGCEVIATAWVVMLVFRLFRGLAGSRPEEGDVAATANAGRL